MEYSNQPILFEKREAWRKWLLENHSTSTELWLAYYKKHTGKVSIVYKEALEEALCFGWIDGQVKSLNDENFIQRFTPRKKRSLWSKINKEKTINLIKEGRMTEAGLTKIEAAKRDGRWEQAYSTQKKVTMPPDMKLCLKNNPVALELFYTFAPSHQNMYIQWVNSAKREETRKRRIERVILWTYQKKKPGEL